MDRLVHWCITLTLISCSSVILLLCFRSPWHATPQATALATTAKQPFSWRPSPWPKQMNILWHCWVCMIVSGDGGQQQLPILSQGSLWRWLVAPTQNALGLHNPKKGMLMPACLHFHSCTDGGIVRFWLGHMQQSWCPSSNWSSILIALLVCKHWKWYLEGVPKTEKKGAKGRGTIGEGSTSLLLLIAQTVGSSPFRLFKSGQVCFSCTEWHATGVTDAERTEAIYR